MLVGKLLAGQDHRHTHGGEQAGEGKLDALLGVKDAVVVQEVQQAFVAYSLDVVGGEINDGLRAITVAKVPAIDGLTHGPCEARLAGSALAQECGADVVLEALVPEP